jgi:type II secretory pathway component HofQ
LSKIPVIGWLFKKKSSYDKQAELLIFITPTIMRGD